MYVWTKRILVATENWKVVGEPQRGSYPCCRCGVRRCFVSGNDRNSCFDGPAATTIMTFYEKW